MKILVNNFKNLNDLPPVIADNIDNGRWYHCRRPLIVKADNDYAVVVLNIFERIAAAFLKMFGCSYFAGVFKSKNVQILEGVEEKIYIMDQGFIQQADRLRPKVQQLKMFIQEFDGFIKQIPELSPQLQQALREDRHIIPLPTELASDVAALDLEKPHHRLAKVQYEVLTFEHLWQERIRFFERHPQLRDSVLDYIRQGHASESEVAGLLAVAGGAGTSARSPLIEEIE